MRLAECPVVLTHIERNGELYETSDIYNVRATFLALGVWTER